MLPTVTTTSNNNNMGRHQPRGQAQSSASLWTTVKGTGQGDRTSITSKLQLEGSICTAATSTVTCEPVEVGGSLSSLCCLPVSCTSTHSAVDKGKRVIVITMMNKLVSGLWQAQRLALSNSVRERSRCSYCNRVFQVPDVLCLPCQPTENSQALH